MLSGLTRKNGVGCFPSQLLLARRIDGVCAGATNDGPSAPAFLSIGLFVGFELTDDSHMPAGHPIAVSFVPSKGAWEACVVVSRDVWFVVCWRVGFVGRRCMSPFRMR